MRQQATGAKRTHLSCTAAPGPHALRCLSRSTAPIAAACCRSFTRSAALSCAPPTTLLGALASLRGELAAEGSAGRAADLVAALGTADCLRGASCGAGRAPGGPCGGQGGLCVARAASGRAARLARAALCSPDWTGAPTLPPSLLGRCIGAQGPVRELHRLRIGRCRRGQEAGRRGFGRSAALPARRHSQVAWL